MGCCGDQGILRIPVLTVKDIRQQSCKIDCSLADAWRFVFSRFQWTLSCWSSTYGHYLRCCKSQRESRVPSRLADERSNIQSMEKCHRTAERSTPAIWTCIISYLIIIRWHLALLSRRQLTLFRFLHFHGQQVKQYDSMKTYSFFLVWKDELRKRVNETMDCSLLLISNKSGREYHLFWVHRSFGAELSKLNWNVNGKFIEVEIEMDVLIQVLDSEDSDVHCACAHRFQKSDWSTMLRLCTRIDVDNRSSGNWFLSYRTETTRPGRLQLCLEKWN